MSKESAIAVAQSAAPESVAQIPEGVPAPTSAPTQSETDAMRLARFARREAEFQSKQEEFKKNQQVWQKDIEIAKSVIQKAKDFEDTRKTDPIKALKDLGFNEAEVINFLSASDEPVQESPEQKAAAIAQAEIKKFQDEQAAEKEKERKARDSEVIRNFQRQISETIKKNNDKFKYCSMEGAEAEQLAYLTVQECLREDRQKDPNALPISPAEAAELVENYYKGKHEAWNKGFEKPLVTPEVPIAKKAAPPPSRTLTNRVNASTASIIPDAVQKSETREAKRARIIARIKQNGLTAR